MMCKYYFVFVLTCILSRTVFTENQSILVCPGRCVNLDVPCNETIENTDCGDFAKCCLDGEISQESGFDFSTITNPSTVDWADSSSSKDATVEEIDQTMSQFGGYTDGFTTGYIREFPTLSTTESETLESSYAVSCPGACIPTEHSSLCQFVIPSEHLCGPTKTCCATKQAAMEMPQGYGIDSFVEISRQNDPEENECPGKCIHPSLSLFCDKILPKYKCPMDSKCCNKGVEVSNNPKSFLQCTGECILPHMSYLCLPPYQLIPGTKECEGPSVCCMNTENSDYLPEVQIMDDSNEQMRALLSSLPDDELPGGVLASDENGQVYYVFQSGQFRPLQSISLADAMGSNYAHYSDVEVPIGRVSLFRDFNGVLYQLAENERESQNPGEFQETESSVFSTTLSPVSNTGNMHERMKDLVISEEGNQVDAKETGIPPGERTMIKPRCPGTCISSYLKFTCIRNSAVYGGFTCPDRSVCCANVKDIERHEQYLESLSPYFRASVVSLNQNGLTCGMKGITSQGDKTDAVTAREWCWQAAIINGQNQYVCGAVIIDSSWILTAASCVTRALNDNEAIYIRAGVTDLTKTENTGVQTKRVLSIFVHHDYNSMSLDNNIALLHLQSPLQIKENVCVVCLPISGTESQSSECTVTGHGFISNAGVMPLKLHKALVPLVDDLDCIANVTETLKSVFILPASSLCAGGHGSKACQGDAGGPLVCKKNGKYELLGLLSWSLGCENEGVPSIYVKVPSFIEWITQIIGANAFLKALT